MPLKASGWTEEDLIGLIRTATSEYLELDYKRCDSLWPRTDGKKVELTKDVSAFANSAGGSIVYGIVEDAHIPVGLDLGFDPAQVTREWIDQVISSGIQRRIDGVRIDQVALTGERSGRVAYVVSVPQSNRAPHMALDKRFHKRLEYTTVMMEEYEVRDVARREESPDLRITLTLGAGPIQLQFAEGSAESGAVQLEASITNLSPQPADYSVFQLWVDRRLRVVAHREFDKGDEVLAVVSSGQKFQAVVYSQNLSVPSKMPIFQGVRFRMGAPIELAVPPGDDEYLIGWIVHSPRMPRKDGDYLLRVRDSVYTLEPLEKTSG